MRPALKTWLFLLGGLLATAARAQPADPRPALHRALVAAHTDSAQGKLLAKLSGSSTANDSIRYFARQAIVHLQRALPTAHGTDSLWLVAYLGGAYGLLGHVSHDGGDQQQAIRFYRQSLTLHHQINNFGPEAAMHVALGTVYTMQRDYLRALQTLQTAVRLAEHQPEARPLLPVCLSRLGWLHQLLGNDSTALRYQLRAVGLLRNAATTSEQSDLVLCFYDLSRTYLYTFNDTTHAERYARQAQEMVERNPLLNTRLTDVLFRRGEVRRWEGRWASARTLLLAAQAASIRNHDLMVLTRAQINLALVEEATGHLPLALRYARQSVSYGRLNTLEDKVLATQTLARLYERLGQPRQALAALHRYVAVRDSATNDAARRRALGQSLRQQYQRQAEARVQALRQAQQVAALRRQRLLLVAGLAGVLLLGTAAWAFGAYRRRQLRRELALRTRLSADLHDEVGTLLTQLAMQTDVLEAGAYAPAQQQAQLREVAQASRRAAAQLQDVVWGVDARNDGPAHLLDRLRDHAYDALQHGEVTVSFATDAAAETFALAPDTRRALYLIFKEALANVLKYAPPASHVAVALAVEGGELVLTVADNGSAPAAGPRLRTSGHGLRNMQARAEAVGGRVRTGFGAVPGQSGFSVEVRVKG